ncbi:MAG: phosphomannomutase [Gammaproteobacteria bacterium]|nr:phosphomannomutase [Gammaproteobacteria bacterium]
MTTEISCFKAYDVRGRIPSELNEDVAFRIGVGVASYFSAKSVVVGYDVRPSSLEILNALTKGINSQGAKVCCIGLCGTEEIYFATNHLNTDAGVMITASHNPADYNGLKIVGKGARPVSMDSGLGEIKKIAERTTSELDIEPKMDSVNIKNEYIEELLEFIDTDRIKPMRIVTNAGNGCAGPILDMLEDKLPIDFTKIQNEPDGSFPNGIPNPLLPENREITSKAVIENSADLGIAWDGDFDRCFFFDSNGIFIENYYLIGLLSEQLLKQSPGDSIVHDPRLVWNTVEEVDRFGGIPTISKSGHSFIKEVMRENNSIYGGEMSGHHYFRDFYYSDSGMIPWLLLIENVSASGTSLTDLVKDRIEKFPVSGEINRTVNNPEELLERVKDHYLSCDPKIENLDGYSFDFGEWRFNLRMSNTEPLVRLNVESRGDGDLMQNKTEEILGLIQELG